MKKNLCFYTTIAVIVAIGIFVDMLTKSLTFEQELPLISGVISIFFVWNTGAGWSILSNQTLLLTIFSAILVLGLILLVVFYRPNSKLFTVGISFVLAGAIGNLIDRVLFGAVRDFLHLDFMSFPVFNIADVLLTFGAIILAVWLIFFWGKGTKKDDK